MNVLLVYLLGCVAYLCWSFYMSYASRALEKELFNIELKYTIDDFFEDLAPAIFSWLGVLLVVLIYILVYKEEVKKNG